MSAAPVPTTTSPTRCGWTERKTGLRRADSRAPAHYSEHEHDLAFAPIWRAASKVVVSRTLEKADWNTRVISENAAGELTALKESGVTLLLFGGSAPASRLTRHGVIDEYQIFVHPVILGGGKTGLLTAVAAEGFEVFADVLERAARAPNGFPPPSASEFRRIIPALGGRA